MFSPGIASALAPLGISALDAHLLAQTTIGEGLAMEPVVDVLRRRSGIIVDLLAFNAPEEVRAARGVIAVASDEVEIGLVEDVSRGIIVTQGLSIAAVDTTTTTYHQILTHMLRVRDLLTPQIPVTITDVVQLADTLVAYDAVTVAEQLGVLPVLAAAAVSQVTLTQGVALTAELLRFLGADAIDSIGIDPALLVRKVGITAQTETIGIEPLTTPRLLLRATVADGVEVEPLELLQSLHTAELIEGVELVAAYAAPDGSFTTWAMNARTGAVTEYSDYVFNSFARMGNRYLGASVDGLYELLGDTDAGEDIIARIKSGFLQFGGTRLSRLKAAYIAARGEGDFILRIIDGDDAQYDYAVETRSVRSTKVHMGKGQRSRYFAFELISDGQDFDLDTLEFVPIVVQRRV